MAFDLEDYATTYRATRDAYLKAANELKLATGPYKAARDAYVAATATYTKSLYERRRRLGESKGKLSSFLTSSLKKLKQNNPENWSKFFAGHEHLPKNFEHISNNCVNQKQLVCDDPNCKAFPFFDEGGLGSGGSFGKDDGTCQHLPCWCVTFAAIGQSTTCEEIKKLCEVPDISDKHTEFRHWDNVGEQNQIDGDKHTEFTSNYTVQNNLHDDKFREFAHWDKVGEQNNLDDSFAQSIHKLRKGHTPTLILMYGKN
jgi:hypothetical protein